MLRLQGLAKVKFYFYSRWRRTRSWQTQHRCRRLADPCQAMPSEYCSWSNSCRVGRQSRLQTRCKWIPSCELWMTDFSTQTVGGWREKGWEHQPVTVNTWFEPHKKPSELSSFVKSQKKGHKRKTLARRMPQQTLINVYVLNSLLRARVPLANCDIMFYESTNILTPGFTPLIFLVSAILIKLI